MRAIVLGQSGQVATELQRCAGAAGVSLVVLGREAADLSNPAAAAGVLDRLLPEADVVINAAAYTAVDRAENEPELARRINADAPAALAAAAARHGVPFLHISTDYVFDGSGTAARRPDDPTGPLNVYGATKLAGEEGIRAAGGVHAILRTSWVFSAQGSNFVRTVLRLARERDGLSMIADQTGGPTSAASIAAALFAIGRVLISGPTGAALGGTWHFAGAPDVTWADFARAILMQAGLPVPVQDIPTSGYPTPARRPANSRLDCSGLEAAFGIPRPDWRADLSDVLATLGVVPPSRPAGR